MTNIFLLDNFIRLPTTSSTSFRTWLPGAHLPANLPGEPHRAGDRRLRRGRRAGALPAGPHEAGCLIDLIKAGGAGAHPGICLRSSGPKGNLRRHHRRGGGEIVHGKRSLIEQ